MKIKTIAWLILCIHGCLWGAAGGGDSDDGASDSDESSWVFVVYGPGGAPVPGIKKSGSCGSFVVVDTPSSLSTPVIVSACPSGVSSRRGSQDSDVSFDGVKKTECAYAALLKKFANDKVRTDLYFQLAHRKMNADDSGQKYWGLVSQTILEAYSVVKEYQKKPDDVDRAAQTFKKFLTDRGAQLDELKRTVADQSSLPHGSGLQLLRDLIERGEG